jgi:peptidoglycan/xylan/chitin deacetylase (PgdA/CDA1 family)
MGWHRGKHYLGRALRFTGLGTLLRMAKPWHGVLALAYHRIGDGTGSPFDRGLWSATPEDFDAQVSFMKRHCDVIGPADLKDVVVKKRGRFGLITFDDGYRDNYRQAFPVLKSHNVPGVFFVSSGFLDRGGLSWWDEIAWMVRSSPRDAVPGGRWFEGTVAFDEPDREAAIRTLLRHYKSLPGDQTAGYVDYLAEATASRRCPAVEASDTWMTWDMVREMRAAGMVIGGHTVNHPILGQLPPERQRDEIAGCGKRIKAELGETMRYFSYPVGGPRAFNRDTRAGLKDEGVEVAFSYYGTLGRFGAWDWYDVPRVAVERYTSRRDFDALVALPQVFA